MVQVERLRGLYSDLTVASRVWSRSERFESCPVRSVRSVVQSFGRSPDAWMPAFVRSASKNESPTLRTML